MRTHFVRFVAVGAFAALALAACGSSSKATSATSPTTLPAAAPPVTTAPQATEAPPTSAPAAQVSVTLAANSTIGKSILVDSNGMTLYVWDNDTTAGKSSCTGPCAAAWPPLDVTGAPAVGTGLTASMYSTVTGPNGEKQAAVNGKPLYTWANDKKPGDATGQGVNGFHVVAADGTKIDG
jgi:predicted lipoprotein with Yx(FWY)xxD motif